jgi:hypothetical protein
MSDSQSWNSIQDLELYELVGRLLGIAMRTGVLLALDWPSLIWKQLTGEALTRADLKAVDASVVTGVLDPILGPASASASSAAAGSAGSVDSKDGAMKIERSAWESAFDGTGLLSLPITRSDLVPVDTPLARATESGLQRTRFCLCFFALSFLVLTRSVCHVLSACCDVRAIPSIRCHTPIRTTVRVFGPMRCAAPWVVRYHPTSTAAAVVVV